MRFSPVKDTAALYELKILFLRESFYFLAVFQFKEEHRESAPEVKFAAFSVLSSRCLLPASSP